MRIIAILFLLTLATPAPAQEREYKSGLQHIVVNRPTPPIAAPVTPQSTGQNTGQTVENTSPYTAIWDKYKSLAAGDSQNNNTQDKPTQDPAPTTPQKADDPAPTTPTGIVGIIDQYRRNKEQQSQMKTLTIKQHEIKTINNE